MYLKIRSLLASSVGLVIFVRNLSKIRENTGASMLEMAIALPVFLILLMGTVDLGLAIRQYLSVTRATYEGIRYGAGLYDNKIGCSGPECPSGSVSNQNINFIEARVRQILTIQGYENADVTLKVEEKIDARNDSDYTYKIIKATIDVPFNAILPFFRIIPIRTNITFTDLYKDIDYHNLY